MKKLFTFFGALVAFAILCSVSILALDDGAVASVNGVEYNSLQDAIDAAEYGDTVVLLKNLDIESNLSNASAGVFVISADDKITIDLNGMTIDVTDNSSGNFIVFYSLGDLTVKNGTVNVTSSINRSWNAQSTVLMNRGGVLTIESGSYNHLGGTDMAIAVENNANSLGDSYMIINGGSITSTYTAIRLRMADTTLNGDPGNGVAELEINGGYIYGENRGVWGQITNAFAGSLGSLDITGGTIGGGLNAINMASDGYNNVPVSISGSAIIDGNIKGEGSDFNITGGTFTVEISSELFAPDFSIAQNGDGTFGVTPDSITQAFTFLGYSISGDGTSIVAGYSVDFEIIDSFCKYNNVNLNDFGIAFGINTIMEHTATSFVRYNRVRNYDAMITSFDPENQTHITARLAMAFYIDLGTGKQYVVENEQGSIELVAYDQVPTTSFEEQNKNN